MESRTISRRDKTTGKRVKSEAAPLVSQHADMIDVSVFAPFAQAVTDKCGLAFDVMCEAKSKDLAVLQLREELKAVPFAVPVE